MSINEKSTAPSLDQYWLDAATKDLTRKGKERIRSEIEAHFAAAMANHMASGLESWEAKVKALKDLGNPKAAAKRFNKQHLTRKNLKHLEHILSFRQSIWMSIYWCFCLPAFEFSGQNLHRRWQTFPFPGGNIVPGTMLAIFVLATVINLMVLKRKQAGPDFILIILVQLVRDYVALFVMLNSMFGWPGGMAGLLWMMLDPRIYLYLKLRKIGDVCREMPPKNDAVA